MKKALITTCALLCIGGFALAQNGGPRLAVGVDATASVASPYVAPEASLTFGSDSFSLGIASKLYWGPIWGDVFVAPYLRANLGAFYLSGGVVAELVAPRERPGSIALSISSSDWPVSPYAALGFDFGIARNGAVKLDIGLEGFISTVYVDDPEDVGEAIGFVAVAPLAVAFTIPKINIGLSYSFGS